MTENAAKYKERTIKVQGGADYLKVAQRVLWFREEKPNWPIRTSFLECGEDHTVARAEIYNDTGILMATAHKYSAKGVGPAKAYHREAAETGAIGRALGLLGYGTDAVFSDDEDDDFIADSPVEKIEPKEAKKWNFPVLKPVEDKGEREESQTCSEYVISFGKFRGSTLSKVSESEIKLYCDYLRKNSKESGKPLSPSAEELLTEVAKYYG